jgi:hypothetical protein
MERLVTLWRNKPWELRPAVITALQIPADLSNVLPSRGATRLLPAIAQKVVYSRGPADTLLVTLVLTDEPSYMGIVSHVAIHTASELDKLLRAFNKTLKTPSGKPSATPRPTRLRQARLQVVLPPDVFIERPPIVEGVPVTWFRWVPLDEATVHVEESAAHEQPSSSPPTSSHRSSGSSSSGAIPRILGHMAWWKESLEAGTNTERAVRQLLLVQNAAVLLEWHLKVPGSETLALFPDPAGIKKAAQLTGEFLGMLQKALARAQKAEATQGETKAKKTLHALPGALQRLLEGVGGLCRASVRPERVAEYEKPLRPGQLIKDWVAANGSSTPAGSTPKSSAGFATGPGAFVLHSMLPAIATQELADAGKFTAEALAAVRETCAEYLQDAIEIAAAESKGAERKRWRALGEPVIETWQRGDSPGAHEARAK